MKIYERCSKCGQQIVAHSTHVRFEKRRHIKNTHPEEWVELIEQESLIKAAEERIRQIMKNQFTEFTDATWTKVAR